jgi:hypothetical protein
VFFVNKSDVFSLPIVENDNSKAQMYTKEYKILHIFKMTTKVVKKSQKWLAKPLSSRPKHPRKNQKPSFLLYIIYKYIII